MTFWLFSGVFTRLGRRGEISCTEVEVQDVTTETSGENQFSKFLLLILAFVSIEAKRFDYSVLIIRSHSLFSGIHHVFLIIAPKSRYSRRP